MPDRLLTPEEVCDRWQGIVSVRTLANWRCDPAGRGPPYKKFGNRIRYPEGPLSEWEQANQYRSTKEY